MASVFESVSCPRCGGGGKYSFNLMHGDRCYGCGGSGVKLSKRGSAAKAEYQRLMQRPAGSIKVGDSVYDWLGLHGGKVWQKVDSIEVDELNPGSIKIGLSRKGKPVCGLHTGASAMLCSVESEAQRLEFLAQAVAYQATLTKMGKVSKRPLKVSP